LAGLESRNETLEADNRILKQAVHTNDNRIQELESRLAFFVKQNDDLKNLLRCSDKVSLFPRSLYPGNHHLLHTCWPSAHTRIKQADEMNRLLAQTYSSLALQTTGLSLFGGIHFHQISHNIHAQPTITLRTEEMGLLSTKPEHAHKQADGSLPPKQECNHNLSSHQ